MQAGPVISVALGGSLGNFRLAAEFASPMQGITALFGPSGCGKTTILRCLAGLTRLPGRVAIGDEIWQDTDRSVFLPPHQRHVGYVFQEASLFPHLTVRDNLLYGARRTGDRTTAAGDFDLPQIVELLGIGHLLDRAPANLSGGERQRVAIGRALLSRPRILLMDEPLAALDRDTKQEILPYLETLHATLAIPVMYVSHDYAEVERLADALVLMKEGRVVATGPLATLQADPALPLLRAPGATIVLEGRITALDHAFGLTTVAVAGGVIVTAGITGSIGEKRRLRVASSDVSLTLTAATDSTILNCLPARIISVEQSEGASQVDVLLSLGADGAGALIAARITRKSLDTLSFGPGDQVIAQIKGVAILAARTSLPD